MVGTPRQRLFRAINAFPIGLLPIRKEMVRADRCPDCGADLDTGYQCVRCSFDGLPLVKDL